MSRFKDIKNKALDIADQIGYPLYEEGYYSDEYIGQKYKYESLEITSYNKCLYITIDSTKVLRYDYDTKESEFIDGKWTELIDIIHEQIPRILYEKEEQERQKQSKEQELKSLEEYFKYYIECEKNKPEVQELIDKKLYQKDITITKRNGQSLITSLATDEYKYIPYTYFQVKHNNKEVAEFQGNPFNLFPNLDHYTKLYKPGEWTDNLKRTINQAKEEEKYLTKKTIDDTANKLIKKFKR